MAKINLEWITTPGTIANFLIGEISSVALQCKDNQNANATFTFSKLSGNIPPGLTLSSSGIISGTPTYASSVSSYVSVREYNFIVRAISNTNQILDGQFIIRITNIVDQDFVWITPPGTIDTTSTDKFSSYKLETQSSANLGILYKLISGELPPGMQLISHSVTKLTTVSQAALGTILYFNNVSTVGVDDLVFGTGIAPGTTVTAIDRDKKIVTLSLPTRSLVTTNTNISFFSPGFLQGVPTILDPTKAGTAVTYRFTIRAYNTAGQIVDRSFNLIVTNVSGPIIEPSATNVYDLGTHFDGTYYSRQLYVNESNPEVQITWRIVSGSLPQGLTLNANGVISGWIEPLSLSGNYGPAGFDGDSIDPNSGAIIEEAQYDYGPYQFNNVSVGQGYPFTIEAYDGVNSDLQKYVFTVFSRTAFTADSGETIDEGDLTIDSTNIRYPVLRETSTILPAGRSDSYYAYKFDGYDYSGGTIYYRVADTFGAYDGSPFDPLLNNSQLSPPLGPGPGVGNNGLPGSFDLVTTTASTLAGLQLDQDTGWLYGHIDPQAAAYTEYSIGIIVGKVEGNVTYESPGKFFTLPVLGDPNNIIKWITDSDLGSIDNGRICDFKVEAISPAGRSLIYELVDAIGVGVRMPQGLSMLPTGEISGRATFESFNIDDYSTTFDNNTTTIDRKFTFRIRARTLDGTASSTRDFTIRLNIVDTEPYENLYLKAMPTVVQRQQLNTLLSDQTIFDPDILYRRTDPNFGIQTDLKMLFISGLTASELSEYHTVLTQNHFTKSYKFGDVRVAYVLDSNYGVKYEVVYLEVNDPGENRDSSGPGLEINLTDVIANPYIDQSGNEYKIVYPNNSSAMTQRVVDGIGYTDRSSLPDWMTSNQPDPTNTGGFKVPLGFVKAVVLAYTQPGQGEKIVFRVKDKLTMLDEISFTIDRYQIDNFYSKFYDINNQTYFSGRETTFDAAPNINVGRIVGTVSYAVTKPYSQINGRPVDYINSNGGIDGITFFEDGDTIVFAQQELFENAGPYDGWVNYSDAFIGDSIFSTAIEGFDTNQQGIYDNYTIVPGFLEKVGGTSPVNRRGGIWRINIVNRVVNLSFVQEITLNERVRIQFGKTYGSAILFYSIDLQPGQTVPYYDVFKTNPDIARRRTTFNNDTTRFFNYRDQYYEPGSQDKYLKFPKYGVFN